MNSSKKLRRMCWTAMAGIAALSLGGFAASADAALTVDNGNFETIDLANSTTPAPLADGAFTQQVGSDVGASDNINRSTPGVTSSTGGTYDHGIQNANTAIFTAGGDNFLFNDAASNAFLSVSATGPDSATLQSNTTYTLTLSVGQRLDKTSQGQNVGPISIALQAGGVDLTPSATPTTPSLINGAFVTYSYTYTTGTVAPGQTLDVRLSGQNAGFDNVTLSATPEPATFAVMGLLGLGLCARRRTIAPRA